MNNKSAGWNRRINLIELSSQNGANIYVVFGGTCLRAVTYAAAPSYQELLEYYQPKVLLGLTATPEREDGRSIYAYFQGRVAAEIRLWEAIERSWIYWIFNDLTDRGLS